MKVRYESSNPEVATVSASGKVKDVTSGKCTVYADAQNGAVKTIEVTVKNGLLSATWAKRESKDLALRLLTAFHESLNTAAMQQ